MKVCMQPLGQRLGLQVVKPREGSVDHISEIQSWEPWTEIVVFVTAGSAGKQVYSKQKLHLSESSDY